MAVLLRRIAVGYVGAGVIAGPLDAGRESSWGPWVPDLRSSQVGFTRLAHLKVPISGEPEIGALARPGHESASSRTISCPGRAQRDPGPRGQATTGETGPRGHATSGAKPITPLPRPDLPRGREQAAARARATATERSPRPAAATAPPARSRRPRWRRRPRRRRTAFAAPRPR